MTPDEWKPTIAFIAYLFIRFSIILSEKKSGLDFSLDVPDELVFRDEMLVSLPIVHEVHSTRHAGVWMVEWLLVL